MSCIIIPTDFSPAAANAVNYGVNLAKDLDACVILFHAYHLPLSATEASVMITESTVGKMKHDAAENLQRQLDKIKADEPGLKVSAEMRFGNTIHELRNFCKEKNPFAIVMGSTGHTPLERALFGSTTLSAFRQLAYPVIAVPPGSQYRAIRKIGLACDLKQLKQGIPVSFISDVTRALNAELYILHVDFHNPRYFPEKNEQLSRLQTMLSELAPVFRFIEHVDIERGINQFAEENKLDLVITIPKKHSLWDSLLHKSGSKQILFGSSIPVMSIHEQ